MIEKSSMFWDEYFFPILLEISSWNSTNYTFQSLSRFWEWIISQKTYSFTTLPFDSIIKNAQKSTYIFAIPKVEKDGRWNNKNSSEIGFTFVKFKKFLRIKNVKKKVWEKVGEQFKRTWWHIERNEKDKLYPDQEFVEKKI